MKTKRTGKILSLLLAVCMVVTMLPTVAFAETGDVDSGAPLGAGGTITAFAELSAAVAARMVSAGTAEDELNLPKQLAATITEGSDDTATGSDTTKETQTTVAEGVSAPTITVTVEEITAPQARGGIAPMAATVNGPSELKSALESETSDTITVAGNITLTEAVEVKASHTLTINSGATLMIGDSSGFATITLDSGKTLTINGSGTLAVKNTEDYSNGIFCMGEIDISGVRLTVENTGKASTGISIYSLLDPDNLTVANLNVAGCTVEISNNGTNENAGIVLSSAGATFDNCTVAIKNQGNGSVGIKGLFESTATFQNGSAVTVELPGSGGTGIFLGQLSGKNDKLVIDGSTLEVKPGGYGFDIIQQAALSGANGGKIKLAEGASLESDNGGLKDQGNVFNKTASVTVGAADATPSATGLTAGDYVWDGSYFTKGGGGTVTGTMTIGGETVSDLTANAGNLTEKGWAWNASTAVLTFSSNYAGEPIAVNCAFGDTVYLAYTGDVSITSSAASTISCSGSLNITGSGGTLELNSTSINSLYCAIEVFNVLTITGSADVDATCAGTSTDIGAAVIYGSRGVTIADSANVTTTATGTGASGIWVELGDINISTTGTVTAGGNGTGGALALRNGKKLNMSGGTLALSGNPLSGSWFTDLNITGGSITIDGTPVYRALLTLSDVNTAIAVTAVIAPSSGYGISSKSTSGDGKLCFLLPEGSQTVTLTADGNTYTGTANVTTSHETTATLTKQLSTTYTVTFMNGSSTHATKTVVSPSTAIDALPTNPTNGSYTFSGWYTGTNGNGTKFNASTPVTSNMTVYAYWTGGGSGGNGGNGGGSGSGGGTATPITATPENKSDQPVTATVPVTATAGAGGAANAAISDKSITDAIAKAQADAKAQNKTSNGIAVSVDVTMPQGSNSLTATLNQSSLNSLVSAGVTSLEINGAPVSISLDLKALQEIQKQSGSNISITITPAAGLSSQAQTMIGNRPVYDITLRTVKDGETGDVASLGSGTATLTIPYTPAAGESTAHLFGVYVDEKGNAVRIKGSSYDVGARGILIPTGHFSVYGVGYAAASERFTDIASHWGRESIDYVAGRELLSGTSETTFSPNTAMTRGMLVTALGRLSGVDEKAYTGDSFTDAAAGKYYTPYVEWAYGKGIVKGTGNSQFAPDRAVTREEIAVIFANYAKAAGQTLISTHEATIYGDADRIGSIYKDGVTAMQQAGIMMGDTNKKFHPKASATRAEVAAMLQRYIELTD